MPLFEYRCRGCQERFEEFVVGNRDSRQSGAVDSGSCGSCGDPPRGPGSCSLD